MKMIVTSKAGRQAGFSLIELILSMAVSLMQPV